MGIDFPSLLPQRFLRDTRHSQSCFALIVVLIRSHKLSLNCCWAQSFWKTHSCGHSLAQRLHSPAQAVSPKFWEDIKPASWPTTTLPQALKRTGGTGCQAVLFIESSSQFPFSTHVPCWSALPFRAAPVPSQLISSHTRTVCRGIRRDHPPSLATTIFFTLSKFI